MIAENINPSLDLPWSSEPSLLIDLTSKRLYNTKYLTKFQKMSFNKTKTYFFRDDLSNSELQNQEKKLDLAENLTSLYKQFYANQYRKYKNLFPKEEEILNALREEGSKFVIGHTSILKFDGFLHWYERIKMINWVEGIERKIGKWELMYPIYDYSKFFEVEKKEVVGMVRDRERVVEERIVREMGVDFGIFED